MKSSNTKKHPNTHSLGIGITEEMFRDIEQISNELSISKSGFIRQSLDIALNYRMNYPEFILIITELCRSLESAKVSMEPQTYQELSSLLDNLIRVLSNPL